MLKAGSDRTKFSKQIAGWGMRAAAIGLGLWLANAGLSLHAQAAYVPTDVAVDLTTGSEDGGGQPQPAGPVERSVNVNLTEYYNAEFDLYEEGFNNRYFFYSNVSNGGMTAKPVVLDIPANLNYTVEKDGKAISYQSGTAVSALGVYMVTIKVDETDGNNITHYTASYRFRIMEAAEQTNPVLGDEGVYTNPGVEDPAPTESQGIRYEDLTEEEQAALEQVFGGSEVSEEELLNEDGSINQDKLNELMAEKLGEIGDVNDIYQTEGVNEQTGMASAYDAVTGYYKHTLISGHQFYTDVQNGTVTQLSVKLRADEGLSFTVYKDGELYEAEDMFNFSEAGSYLLIPQSSDVVFLDAYQEEKPTFSFRIMDNAANDLSVFRAPEGYWLGDIYLDNLPCTTYKLVNRTTVLLREDGYYKIEVTDGSVTYNMEYKLDRIRPRFFVDVQKNRADISYLSDDAAKVMVYRNQQPYDTKGLLYSIRETGLYWFYVFDDAGNISQQAFEVKYGFNKGAVVAILIIVLFIGGLIGYIRYLNTHVKVR
ncbi:MAG: hypothetical protein IKO10_10665 [Lachnospiraceae bacterium]|nr:hypothetical protein [Lachnospiraceae bacterium]